MQDDEKLIKSFTFDIPVELVKSNTEGSDDEAEDSWKIRGVASTEDEDLQGEVLVQDGIDLSVIKSGKGLFNNNHSNNPEDIIGAIEDAEIINVANKKVMEVKGYLFKHQPRAQAYYNIMKSLKKGSAPRVHYSVEGKVVERDRANSKKIQKAIITKVALTLDPVNSNTFASLAKSLTQAKIEIEKQEFFDAILAYAQEVKKAMEAGCGHSKAPTERKGGEALGKESLDKKKKKINSKQAKKLEKALIDALSEAITTEMSKQYKGAKND